jgi:hypothetical protein
MSTGLKEDSQHGGIYIPAWVAERLPEMTLEERATLLVVARYVVLGDGLCPPKSPKVVRETGLDRRDYVRAITGLIRKHILEEINVQDGSRRFYTWCGHCTDSVKEESPQPVKRAMKGPAAAKKTDSHIRTTNRETGTASKRGIDSIVKTVNRMRREGKPIRPRVIR